MVKRGLKLFIFIAFIEHIILAFVFAVAIYTKPRRIERVEKPIQVDLIKLPQLPEFSELQERIKAEKEMVEIPEELTMKAEEILERALAAAEDKPFQLKPRSPVDELNPEKFMLGYLRRRKMKGVERGEDMPFKAREVPGNRERVPFPRRSRAGIDRTTFSPPRGSPIGEVYEPAPPKPKVGSPSDSSFSYRIEGEVKGRKIEYIPPDPEVPGEEVGEVVLSFWVDPEGYVFKVQREKTAGSVELERIAKEWVRDIKFAPLPEGVEQKPQQGRIIIKFKRKLKK